MLDVNILGGMVIDGSGTSPFRADVGISGNRIVLLGDLRKTPALLVYDVEGHVVSPGFVDMHSHSDLMLLADPRADEKTYQGVTSELLGQDGLGVAPIKPNDKQIWKMLIGSINGSPPIPWRWTTFGDYLDTLEVNGTATNVSVLVPHGNLRMWAMGMADRPATNDEVQVMRALLRDSLKAGGMGLSTGLAYAPACFSTKDELICLGEELGKQGGFLVVHLRNESDFVTRSLEEVLDFAQKTHVPVHISHLKVGGKDKAHLFFRLLEMIDEARQQGLDVTFDQYPYTACSTALYAILPPWVQEGGPAQIVDRLKNPSVRSQIREQFLSPWERGENYVKAAGWDGIYITGVKYQDRNGIYEGKNLKEIGELQGKDPAEATFDILIEEELSISMIGFIIQEEAIEAGLRHPAQMIGTDGLLGKLARVPHPRVYGTFPRILGRYVRGKKILPLEKAIQKMTSNPSARLGLYDRGEIKVGKLADLVVFNPETVIDKATYELPHQHPEGISHVLVGGIPVITRGAHTGKIPGHVLRRIHGS